MSTHLTKHFKSILPPHNIHHQQEAITTDTVCYNTPTDVDSGDTQAQFFYGLKSLENDR